MSAAARMVPRRRGNRGVVYAHKPAPASTLGSGLTCNAGSKGGPNGEGQILRIHRLLSSQRGRPVPLNLKAAKG